MHEKMVELHITHKKNSGSDNSKISVDAET